MMMPASAPGGSGATPAEASVVLSLSETEALCTRAARGAGLDWGTAEEAGGAARWLAARGLPGCALLLRCLQAQPLAPPVPRPGRWSGSAPQCPLRLGMALVDHAGLPEGLTGDRLTLEHVALPGLLLPFADQLARRQRCGLWLTGPGAPFRLGSGGAALAAFCALALAERLTLQRRAGPTPEMAPTALPATPLAVWRRLEALALGAVVPASETSRAGAGAGDSDND